MIKVGLVGYGFMGRMHAQCHTATNQSVIAAVADPEPDRQAEAKAKYGCSVYNTIDEMLSAGGLDAVDICAPTYLHEEHVVKAASAGVHILCEKPMALTVESCDNMINAVAKAGVKSMIAQVIRFWPEYSVLKEITDSGKYGKIQWLCASRLSVPATWSWKSWLYDPSKSGGAVLDLHIHDQDFIAYLIGVPKSVSAVGCPGSGGGIDSVSMVGWGHEGGARSQATGSLDMSGVFPFNMSLLVKLEKGSIKLDSGSSPSLMVYPENGDAYAPKLPEPPVSTSNETSGNIGDLGGYYNEIKYFADCLEKGKDPTDIVTLNDAREAVRICLAVRKAAETGEIVSL